MPFGYSEGDYHHIFRTKRFKIALCGDGSKEDYLNAGILPQQIHIIERPIDTETYTPLNVQRDHYRLLFVGRIHPMKRLPSLIKMLSPLFKDYSRLHLHIVADTEKATYTGAVREELNKLQTIIKQSDMSDRVVFRGKCVGYDLLREYSEASIHLLPSSLDRRATVVQEAITMGMQCICTHRKSYDWPEFSEDGKHLVHLISDN